MNIEKTGGGRAPIRYRVGGLGVFRTLFEAEKARAKALDLTTPLEPLVGSQGNFPTQEKASSIMAQLSKRRNPPPPDLTPGYRPTSVVYAEPKKTKQVRKGIGTKASPRSILGGASVRKKRLMGS